MNKFGKILVIIVLNDQKIETHEILVALFHEILDFRECFVGLVFQQLRVVIFDDTEHLRDLLITNIPFFDSV